MRSSNKTYTMPRVRVVSLL